MLFALWPWVLTVDFPDVPVDILTDIVALYKGYHRYQHEYVDVSLAELPVCAID